MTTELATKQTGIIQVALKSEIVKNCDEAKLSNRIVQSVTKAAQYCGHKLQDGDVAFIVGGLLDVLRRRHPTMRVDELPIAIERGVLGDYGEYFGINVTTIIKFVKAYMESESRAKELKEALTPAEDPKRIPTPEELASLENEVIRTAYLQYLERGYYHDYGNHVYHKLDARGLIRFTPEAKRGFMEQARKSIEARNNPATAISFAERSSMRLTLRSVATGTETGVALVTREAKQIALMIYFENLSKLDIDITEELNHASN